MRNKIQLKINVIFKGTLKEKLPPDTTDIQRHATNELPSTLVKNYLVISALYVVSKTFQNITIYALIAQDITLLEV